MKKLLEKHPLPWSTSGIIQNDGSCAVLDGNDERVLRIDGGETWTSTEGATRAKELCDMVNEREAE